MTDIKILLELEPKEQISSNPSESKTKDAESVPPQNYKTIRKTDSKNVIGWLAPPGILLAYGLLFRFFNDLIFDLVKDFENGKFVYLIIIILGFVGIISIIVCRIITGTVTDASTIVTNSIDKNFERACNSLDKAVEKLCETISKSDNFRFEFNNPKKSK